MADAVGAAGFAAGAAGAGAAAGRTTSALPPVSAARESLAKPPALGSLTGALVISASSLPVRASAFFTLVTS
ncbi:hypothetical protein D3C80_1757020 [compost metagenome]